jgi:eukaryotic-like serine/threonine-protein kinase
MIAVPKSKSEMTACERWCHSVPESAIHLGYHQDLTHVLVGTVTRISSNKPTPHGNEIDSRQPRGCTVAPRRLKVGHDLGPYRLLEWLGRGGEGDVWKAVRLEHGHEFVALKILRPSLASNPARKAQFRREAERGVGMVGPSLLNVHELNEIDGYHFIAFTYVEATALNEIIRRRHAFVSRGRVEKVHQFVTMTPEEYLGSMACALAKAARALASVHDQRIVHRDIKPANILMDNRCHGKVYLCDFGLGRDLEIATAEQMRDGAGTPVYMAPERLLRFTADEIKCDIYSMGVTLCEALTLKRPFQIPAELPLPALVPFLAGIEPLPARSLAPDFPAELETIIMKAMARDPRQRYESARELASDLDHFASRWSRRCRPQTPHQRLRCGTYHPRVSSKGVRAVVGRPRCSSDTANACEFAAGSDADPFNDSPSA